MTMVAIHMVCSLLSYAAFLMAFVSGVLFLIQERQLKRKTLGWLFHRLPSLDALDQANFLAIGIGFALLSAGLVFGLIGAGALLDRGWMSDPKTSATLVLWGLYLGLWLLRLRATLRGRRVALLSMLGFSLVVFSFLGMSRLSPHPYL